jgi:hypothetical protein
MQVTHLKRARSPDLELGDVGSFYLLWIPSTNLHPMPGSNWEVRFPAQQPAALKFSGNPI